MKLRIIIILSFFFLSILKASAFEDPPFRNITAHAEPKKYKEITFLDQENKILKLTDFNSKFHILNFWATWCAPCKIEMPSLDELNKIKDFTVYPINLEGENPERIQKFYKSLNIKNLPFYFDENMNLVKLFSLRGIPTTIILDKERQEIARIIGEVDFSDEKFITWLKSYYN